MTERNETSTSRANSNGNGSNQSPINIDKLKSTPKIYPPIVMNGYADTGMRMTLKNTGHTAEIRLASDSSRAFLSGGPLKEKYKFLQYHFHWGSTNALGSEHSIDGNFYSMEAHFVHYNQNYENVETSLKNSDGFAVVALFFVVNSESPNVDHPEIAKITNYLPSVKTVGSTKDVLPDVLEWMKDYCFRCSQYYTYHGSLTTPPFSENVIWLIYPVPVEISNSQIELFRQINNSEKSNLTSNRRQTQLLDGRQVYLATNEPVPRNSNEDPKSGREIKSTAVMADSKAPRKLETSQKVIK